MPYAMLRTSRLFGGFTSSCGRYRSISLRSISARPPPAASVMVLSPFFRPNRPAWFYLVRHDTNISHRPCPGKNMPEARLLREYGMLHLRESEPEEARKRLRAALEIFYRLGAKKDTERT